MPISAETCLGLRSGCSSRAEQPSWGQLAQRLLVTRPNDKYSGFDYRRPGVWAFDPGATRFRLLAPLHEGSAVQFSALDDRVVVFAYPGDYELDAVTWRLLRRYRAVEAPGGRGWSIFGAIVSETQARALGGRSGRYGFGVCIREYVFNGYEWCLSNPFPGRNGPSDGYDLLSLLLRRNESPNAGTVNTAKDVLEFGHSRILEQLISYDPSRGGFWLGDDDKVGFFPLTRSGVADVTQVVRPAGPAAVTPPEHLTSLYYHPSERRFFAVLEKQTGASIQPRRFVAMNEKFEVTETYSAWNVDGPFIDIPTAFASLGTAPETYEQLIPIVAHAPGRNGTFWLTDL
jgi:hypothetical protein